MSEAPMEALEPRLFFSSGPNPGDDEASAGAPAQESLDPPVQLSTHNRSRDIFGRDDRTRVRNATKHPYAAVGLLESWWDDGSGFACTGALVGRYHVLTAAHCVYDDGAGRADEVDFTPGFNSGTKPFGTVRGGRVRIDPNYPHFESSADDYALVTLTKPVGKETGWFGFGNYATRKFRNMSVRSTGYPGDRLDGNAMYTQRGEVSFATTSKLMTRLDVALGQSGSPIYRKDNTIVGVLSASNSQYTYASRISSRRFHRLETWIKKDERAIKAKTRERASALPFSTQSITTTSTAAPAPLWDDVLPLLA